MKNECISASKRVRNMVERFYGKPLKGKAITWNSVMPIIAFVEKIGETDKRYGTLCYVTTTYIRIGNHLHDFKLEPRPSVVATKLEATWGLIVSFVKNYDTQKKGGRK